MCIRDSYNTFSDLIQKINNQVLSLSGSVQDRIQSYLTLINNVNIKEVMPSSQFEALLGTLSSSEQNLFKIIYQSNIKIFEVVYLQEFDNLNQEIIQAYIQAPDLYQFISYLRQILIQNYYDETESEEIIQDIIQEANQGILKEYFTFENNEAGNQEEMEYLSQWKKVDNFQQQIRQAPRGEDILSKIFTNRKKIYGYFKIENFINYTPLETFAPNIL